jgi:hypothetical protein
LAGIGANSKGTGDDFCDALSVLVDLLFGEADYLEAASPEIEVAGPVALECDPTAVVRITVGFDDEPSIAPEEVDQVRPDSDVDLRSRQAVDPAELQKITL